MSGATKLGMKKSPSRPTQPISVGVAMTPFPARELLSMATEEFFLMFCHYCPWLIQYRASAEPAQQGINLLPMFFSKLQVVVDVHLPTFHLCVHLVAFQDPNPLLPVLESSQHHMSHAWHESRQVMTSTLSICSKPTQ